MSLHKKTVVFESINQTLDQRYSLSFNISHYCIIDLLINTPWENIIESLSYNFNIILSKSIEKIGLMELNNNEEEIFCNDTESFWSMIRNHWTEEKKINMKVFASQCYFIKCQWENFPSNEGIAKIAEDSTPVELANSLLTALRLVSAEKLVKIQVIDGEGDPIGVECATAQVLLRRYNKHQRTDPNVKVLVTTETIKHQFSNPTFDSRALELTSTNTDYLGII